MDLDAINATIRGLPQAALKLAPDDLVLIYIVGSIPTTVSKENAKETMISLSLLCRRLGVVFNELASEQEKLIQEWQG